MPKSGNRAVCFFADFAAVFVMFFSKSIRLNHLLKEFDKDKNSLTKIKI
jgi:hypothetical protein